MSRGMPLRRTVLCASQRSASVSRGVEPSDDWCGLSAMAERPVPGSGRRSNGSHAVTPPSAAGTRV